MEGSERRSSSSNGGAKQWVLVLLFSIFIFLFLPSFLSSSFRGFRPAGLKHGWDTLNFFLVLFAILCGIFGRRNCEDGVVKPPTMSTPTSWLDGSGDGRNQYSDRVLEDEVSQPLVAGNIRRMRSSSSYPDLRLEAASWGQATTNAFAKATGIATAATAAEGWRSYDDIHLYRRRPESTGWESQSFRYPDTNTIPVETSALRRSPTPRTELPERLPSPPLPMEQQRRQSRRRSSYSPPGRTMEKDVILDYQSSHPPSPPDSLPERHRRRRSLETLSEWEVEQDAMLEPQQSHLPTLRDARPPERHRRRQSLEALPEWADEQDAILEPQKFHKPTLPDARPPERHRRRRSLETFPEWEAEQYLSFKPEKTNVPSPPPTAPTLRHHRRRSVEDLPSWGAEQGLKMEEKPYESLPSSVRHRRRKSVNDLQKFLVEQEAMLREEKPKAPPPAPPPLPPPHPGKERERNNHKKRSRGGAKDIAAAIALFYQKKKKGSKAKRTRDDTALHYCNSNSPPPALPPPPSSVFHQLFFNKNRGGSKSQRIHSISPAILTPPTPPPPLPTHSSQLPKKHVSGPLPPPEAQPPTLRSKKPVPLPPSPPSPATARVNMYTKRENSNLYWSSLPPPSPIRPPPPPESDIKDVFSDEEVVMSTESREIESESSSPAAAVGRKGGANAVFFPSPDVNNKADLFIARFRAGLKLEKLNSYKEKQQEHRPRQQLEEEFMMVGGLFDDDP